MVEQKSQPFWLGLEDDEPVPKDATPPRCRLLKPECDHSAVSACMFAVHARMASGPFASAFSPGNGAVIWHRVDACYESQPSYENGHALWIRRGTGLGHRSDGRPAFRG